RHFAIGASQDGAVFTGVEFQRRRFIFADAQIQLLHLPWPKSFGDLFGKSAGIGSGTEYFTAHQACSLVIAMTVARLPVETRHDHVRTIHTDGAHDVAQHTVAAPVFQRFVYSLGETEICHAREKLIDSVITPRGEQLFRPDNSQSVVELGPNEVGAAF